MSSKNVNKIGQSAALESTNLNSATKPDSSETSMKSSKAKSLTSTDIAVNPGVSVNPDVTIQHEIMMPLDYTDYPPFTTEQHTRVSDTYKSIEDKMTDDKMAKTIQKQFLDDITVKSVSYKERVEAGEDIEVIRTEQAEFLNSLIEQTLGSVETINASKTNADEEMKTIVSKTIIDLIKEGILIIGLEKNKPIENDNISVKLVVKHKDENGNEEVIYEGEEIVLMESTNTNPDPVTDEEI